ncbi:hypothetical protein C0Q99_24195, partial [Streptomyces albidoflavus]
PPQLPELQGVAGINRTRERGPGQRRAAQWWPLAVREAPPKRRATARNGRVTTVAIAPPI